MARDLDSGIESAVAESDGTIAFLFEIETSAGAVRLCTAPVDLLHDGQEWQGIGGVLYFTSIEETGDPTGQGVELVLSGVEQSVIAAILTANVRGRRATITLVHLEDGNIVAAQPLYVGLQLSDYRISERRPETGAGSVDLRTRVSSPLAALAHHQGVLTNEASHNAMLERAGLAIGDTFFRNVAAVAGREVYWGRNRPWGSGGDGNRTRRARPK